MLWLCCVNPGCTRVKQSQHALLLSTPTALIFLVCLDPPSQCTEGCCAGTVHLWFWLHFPQAVVSGLVLAWTPLTAQEKNTAQEEPEG